MLQTKKNWHVYLFRCADGQFFHDINKLNIINNYNSNWSQNYRYKTR